MDNNDLPFWELLLSDTSQDSEVAPTSADPPGSSSASTTQASTTQVVPPSGVPAKATASATTSKPYPPWLKAVHEKLMSEMDLEQPPPPKRWFSWPSPTPATNQATTSAAAAESGATSAVGPTAAAEFGVLKTVNITPEITFSHEKGKYGDFYRLRRGQNWFALSQTQWWKVVQNKRKLMTVNSTFKISQDKEVRTALMGAIPYITFVHSIKRRDGSTFNSCVSLNFDEFQKLLDDSPQVVTCSECHNKTTAYPLVDGRLLKTKLSPGHLRAVEENNEEAYNQLAMQCTYCGGNWDIDVCHCHHYNCKKCEPDNFCKKCGQCRLREVKSTSTATSKGACATL